jgi:hypothetical protein
VDENNSMGREFKVSVANWSGIFRSVSKSISISPDRLQSLDPDS